ncbi:hypothetical protein FA10DRAFT_267334 [Acaromyces ingoldii]|uniref:5'-3' DNA helicase ZGRF1-like N-terminal domain-containing protein n=1 Tax=Acaromyces ingoldii TaxID=215250 RepID=A0A316YT44_9BASI|nr:hypothetical protein FA10DRAFT_267334 [Acaromyces ingoldii]PWN90905.1 hypothetical protein FA10DRAFT_267334 [Acaromyces ingoldii]
MSSTLEQPSGTKATAWTETYQVLYAKGPRKSPNFFDGVVTFHLHNKLILLRDDIGLLLLESFYSPRYHGGLPTYRSGTVAGSTPSFGEGTKLEVDDFLIEIGERSEVKEKDISVTLAHKGSSSSSMTTSNSAPIPPASKPRTRQKAMSRALLSADDILASTVLGPQKVQAQQSSPAQNHSRVASNQTASTAARSLHQFSNTSSVVPQPRSEPAPLLSAGEGPRPSSPPSSPLKNTSFMSVKAAMNVSSTDHAEEAGRGGRGRLSGLSSSSTAKVGFRVPLKSTAARLNGEPSEEAEHRPTKTRRLGTGMTRTAS